MATTRSFTSSYSGDDIQGYILQSLAGSETINAGINLQENVKYKRAIKRFQSSGIVQSGSCDFNPQGTLTITENVLEPKWAMVTEEICHEDLWDLWSSTGMGAGMNNEQPDAEIVDAVTNEFVNRVGLEVEEAMWQGDSAGSTGGIKDLIDGYNKILSTTGATQAIHVAGTALTSSNILTEMNKVYSAIPAGVRKKGVDAVAFFVSYKTAALYRQNLAAQGDNDSANEPVLRLYGHAVIPVAGIGDDKIAAGELNNFYAATDLTDDLSTVELIDLKASTGDDKVRFKMKFKFDVNVGFVQEIVYYFS